MTVPESLAHLDALPGGGEWLDSLPGLIGQAEKRWDLRMGAVYQGCHVSFAAPAEHSEFGAVVVKLQFPNRESDREADALRCWSGDGAVRLLDHDADLHALLLERCVPGTSLGAAEGVDAMAVMAELLRLTLVTTELEFTSVDDEARGWAERLPRRWRDAGRPFPRRLVDQAVSDIADLLADEQPAVLVNADLHGDNVLAAQREPWLVIDPKPLVGERAFAPAPVVRSFEFGHSKEEVLRRLDRLSEELQVDVQRARRWTRAQTTAWCVESAYRDQQVEVVEWLSDSPSSIPSHLG